MLDHIRVCLNTCLMAIEYETLFFFIDRLERAGIQLKADLVKGSHGRIASSRDEAPVLISNVPDLLQKDHYQPTEIRDLILNHLIQ